MDAPTINVSSGDGSSGKSNLLTYAALGVGALFLINSMNNTNVKPIALNQDDYNFLNNTGPKALQSMVDHDTSPVIFTTPGNTPRTPEQTAQILQALKKRYVDEAQVGTLSFNSNMFADAMLAILDITNTDVRQQTLDLFVKMFDLYSQIWLSTVTATCNSVAAITKAAGEEINNAEECTEWTWAKKTDYTSSQTSTTNTTVSTRASSTKVLFGILGSGGSATTMHNTIKTENLTESETIQFIPTCTSKQVNLAAVEAILIAQGAALKSVYDPLRAVIALAPYIPKPNANKIAGVGKTVLLGYDSNSDAPAIAAISDAPAVTGSIQLI